MSAQPFVDALGRTLGLNLALSPAGDLAFALDGRGFLLQWRETSQSFVIYAEIGHLAGWRDGEVCRRLLSANFLLAETQGAALSYDGINNVVGLNYAIPIYGMQPEDFVRVVDNVAELTLIWKENLKRLTEEQKALVLDAQEALAQEEPENSPGAEPHLLRV